MSDDAKNTNEERAERLRQRQQQPASVRRHVAQTERGVECVSVEGLSRGEWLELMSATFADDDFEHFLLKVRLAARQRDEDGFIYFTYTSDFSNPFHTGGILLEKAEREGWVLVVKDEEECRCYPTFGCNKMDADSALALHQEWAAWQHDTRLAAALFEPRRLDEYATLVGVAGLLAQADLARLTHQQPATTIEINTSQLGRAVGLTHHVVESTLAKLVKEEWLRSLQPLGLWSVGPAWEERMEEERSQSLFEARCSRAETSSLPPGQKMILFALARIWDRPNNHERGSDIDPKRLARRLNANHGKVAGALRLLVREAWLRAEQKGQTGRESIIYPQPARYMEGPAWLATEPRERLF